MPRTNEHEMIAERIAKEGRQDTADVVEALGEAIQELHENRHHWTPTVVPGADLSARVGCNQGRQVTASAKFPLGALRTAAEVVAGVVTQKSAIPILTHALLDFDGKPALCGTDLDVAIRYGFGGKVFKIESGCVPAKLLATALKSFGGEEVSVTAASGAYVFESEAGDRAKLLSMPGVDYPRPLDFTAQSQIAVPAGEWNRLHAAVNHAIPVDSVRMGSMAARIENKAGKRRAAATDGHRLAIEVGGESTEFEAFMLSAPALRSIASLPGDTILEIGEQAVRVRSGAVEILARRQDGSLPDFDRIVPATFARRIVADRVDLIAGLRKLSPMAGGEHQAFDLRADDDAINLEMSNARFGEIAARVDIGDVESGEMSFRANLAYVLAALDSLVCELVEIAQAEPVSAPLILRPFPFDGPNAGASTRVVVPLFKDAAPAA